MALALRENREYNAQEIVIERPDGSYATALAHANPLAPLLRGREESPRAALGAPSGSDRHDRLGTG